MATQMVSQAGNSNLFCNSSSFGIGDMYGLHDLSKAEIAAPRLIMLANVALTGEVNNGCCDYALEEDKQMAELTTVYENSFSDSEGERMEMEESVMESEPAMFELMEVERPQVQETNISDNQTPTPDTPPVTEKEKDEGTPPVAEEKNKSTKSKPFQCRPCQYKAESEEEFVHHIKDHSAKRFIDHDTQKNTKDSGSCSSEEVDTSKGPIRCDRCGYNTNRIDHYLAHLKHHNKAAENERVYKCTICTYTTVSEYHWKKHLRNHFPRIVYTCSQCSYFSDRKNNYIQHIRTHTGERPYQCIMCPYSSSQKTHLTRHMRTHSGEKPFKCEQCNYVASNQHEVTRHARQLHNGPKPLTCPHCNYKTADRSNFKKHVELHVNPRQFLCPVCDYAASKKCNLQYHIKSRHSGCTDITMDVSKVKLRTKKEVPASEISASKQEEKENSEIRSESVEKKTDGKLKQSKEKCETLKSSVGQGTKRSCKISSQKTVDDDDDDNGDKTALKSRRAKRKLGSVSEKPLKTNDTQNTGIKKTKFVRNTQPVREVLKKGNRGGKSQKKKLRKSNQQKPLKKKTILANADNAESKTKKASVDNDAESNIQQTHAGSESDVTLGVSCAAEKVDDLPVAQEEHKESQLGEEGSQLGEEGSQLGEEGSQLGEEGSQLGEEGSQLGEEGSQLGEEGSQLGEEGSQLGEEGSQLGEEGSQLGEEGSQLGEEGSQLGEEGSHEEEGIVNNTFSSDNVLNSEIKDSCELLLEKDNSEEVVAQPDNPVVSHDLHKIDTETESSPEVQTPDCETLADASAAVAEAVQCHPEKETEDSSQMEHSLQFNSDDLSPSPSSATVGQDPKCSEHRPCDLSSACLDVEEDEGIHSHEGSDISDNISERSDDSGLNGLQCAQETLCPKPSDELPQVDKTLAAETFVCIFCDRTFKKAEEYTKHLKRHLVNVYYLEKAAQDRL